MARPIYVTYCTHLGSDTWMSNSGKVRHSACSRHPQLSLNINLITFFQIFGTLSLAEKMRNLMKLTWLGLFTSHIVPTWEATWMSNSGKIRHSVCFRHPKHSLNINLITFFNYLVLLPWPKKLRNLI